MSVTLIDVTKAAEPAVLADSMCVGRTWAACLWFGNLFWAALVAEQSSMQAAAPQTIRIMDFRTRCTAGREFTEYVFAISRDERRGLTSATTRAWRILLQSLAEDPEVEKAYAHHVIYDH